MKSVRIIGGCIRAGVLAIGTLLAAGATQIKSDAGYGGGS